MDITACIGPIAQDEISKRDRRIAELEAQLAEARVILEDHEHEDRRITEWLAAWEVEFK